jgi:hypothetical protein
MSYCLFKSILRIMSILRQGDVYSAWTVQYTYEIPYQAASDGTITNIGAPTLIDKSLSSSYAGDYTIAPLSDIGYTPWGTQQIKMHKTDLIKFGYMIVAAFTLMVGCAFITYFFVVGTLPVGPGFSDGCSGEIAYAKGQILDKDTHQPISDATIKIRSVNMLVSQCLTGKTQILESIWISNVNGHYSGNVAFYEEAKLEVTIVVKNCRTFTTVVDNWTIFENNSIFELSCSELI